MINVMLIYVYMNDWNNSESFQLGLSDLSSEKIVLKLPSVGGELGVRGFRASENVSQCSPGTFPHCAETLMLANPQSRDPSPKKKMHVRFRAAEPDLNGRLAQSLHQNRWPGPCAEASSFRQRNSEMLRRPGWIMTYTCRCDSLQKENKPKRRLEIGRCVQHDGP